MSTLREPCPSGEATEEGGEEREMTEEPGRGPDFDSDEFMDGLRGIEGQYAEDETLSLEQRPRAELEAAVQHVVLYADQLREDSSLGDAFQTVREIHPEESEYLEGLLGEMVERNAFSEDEISEE